MRYIDGLPLLWVIYKLFIFQGSIPSINNPSHPISCIPPKNPCVLFLALKQSQFCFTFRFYFDKKETKMKQRKKSVLKKWRWKCWKTRDEEMEDGVYRSVRLYSHALVESKEAGYNVWGCKRKRHPDWLWLRQSWRSHKFANFLYGTSCGFKVQLLSLRQIKNASLVALNANLKKKTFFFYWIWESKQFYQTSF